MPIVLLVSATLTILAGAAKAEPRDSGDVVKIKVVRCSYADGLIGHRIELTIRDGWHLYAMRGERDHPRGTRPAVNEVSVEEVRVDGKKRVRDVWYHTMAVAKRGVTGDYWAYAKTASIIFWVNDDADGATVSVRVKVAATDGKKSLPESILTATVK